MARLIFWSALAGVALGSWLSHRPPPMSTRTYTAIVCDNCHDNRTEPVAGGAYSAGVHAAKRGWAIDRVDHPNPNTSRIWDWCPECLAHLPGEQ